ncbi:MAG: hypothetical protein IAF38_11065 [Bacteroidia bacterium]|nr:hypothetical protein [Bacteroidia bacterium]
MKKIILSALLGLTASPFFSQVSNAKLQWSRKQLGVASDFEISSQGYRDPSTGNVFVLYKGSYNFGVVRFDNSGANTGNYKHIAPMAGGSSASMIKYAGNNEVIAAANESGYNAVMKFNMSGNLIWKYKELNPNYAATYFYNNTSTAVHINQNADVIATSSQNDSASITKLNSAGQFQWNKVYHPTGYDAGLYSDVITDNFNNIVGCGTIRNTAGNNFDGFIAAHDEFGNKTWEHLFNGAANGMDSVVQILMDNSGNSYIGGFVTDSSATNRTLFVAKYNASGGLQYFKKFHVPLQTNAAFGGICLDALNNLYLTGTSYSNATTGTAWLVKYSGSGTFLWSNNYNNAGFNYEVAEEVSADQLGNIYFAGTMHSSVFGIADEFLRKVNSAGVVQWTQAYNHANGVEDRATDLLVDNSGNSFIVGTNASYMQYDANVTLNKFSASGILQWEGFFDSPGNLTDNAVKIIRDGSHAVYTLSNIQNNISNSDVAITKYNAKGILLWQIMYDNASVANVAHGMHMDAQKNLYVLASATSGSDSKLLKYDSLGTLIWENTYNVGYQTISGNASGTIYLGGGLFGYLSGFCLVVNTNGATTGTYNPPSTGNGFNRALSSALSASNEFYVLSLREDYPVIRNNINITKYNASGTPVWSKLVNNLDSTNYGTVWPKEIELDGNGNVYAMSLGKDFTHTYGFIHLAKYNSGGTFLWQQKYNNSDAGYYDPNDLEVDSYNQVWTSTDGKIQKYNPSTGALYFESVVTPQLSGAGYITGTTLVKRYSANALLMTSPISLPGGNGGFALTKLDSSGNYIWHSVYLPTLLAGASGTDFTFDNQGRIYVHCNSKETEGSLDDVVTLKFCDIAVPTISSSGATTNICPGTPVTITAGSSVNYQSGSATTLIPTGSHSRSGG